MTCVLTGAVAYFPEYNEWARGDMHLVGGSYIFYGNPREHSPLTDGEAHYSCRVDGGFHRPTKPYEVYVFAPGKVLDLRDTL
jgi:hypothetical protein